MSSPFVMCHSSMHTSDSIALIYVEPVLRLVGLFSERYNSISRTDDNKVSFDATDRLHAGLFADSWYGSLSLCSE